MSLLNRLFGNAALPEPQPRVVATHAELAARFWERWAQLQPEVSAALSDGEPQRFENELCEAVAAIHPELHFAVEAGQRAIYALLVTAQEDPDLRPYTDAWKAAAPADDHLWEYHDHVPPVPDPDGVTVNLDGQHIELAEVRIAVQTDEAEGVVDVAVHHPAFAELSQTSLRTMTFLPLDAALGERLAARRLRRVETALAEPENAVTLREFRYQVRALDGDR